MKKTLLFLSFTAILFSCKKDENSTLTTTDVSGTSVVKGNVSKNIITPDGFGGYSNSSRVAAAGVNVSVKVNKNALYPNSNAQGADIYTGTSDANGNYAITVRTNATGVSALISIDGFNATLDTVVNGVTKAGFYSTYSGTSQNRTLVMGQNFQFDYNFFASNLVTNPNNTSIVAGTAVITGSIGIQAVKEFTTGGGSIYNTTVVKAPGKVVYMTFSNDPNTLATKSYTTTTDAAGYYSFTVATVAQGTQGFFQNANIWIPDFAGTRDTIKVSNAVITGPAGVFQMESTNQNGVYNGAIRNATHLSYTNFVQN